MAEGSGRLPGQVKEDMGGEVDMRPAAEGISFADINKDMDQPTLGCTLQAPACHGGAMPTGVMKLAGGALNDMGLLMANYQEVLKEVDMMTPEDSPIVTKPLAERMEVTHTGGKTYFPSTSDPTYQRWLKWIQLGAKFEFVATSGGN